MLDTFDFDPPPNIPWTKNMKVFFCVWKGVFSPIGEVCRSSLRLSFITTEGKRLSEM